MNTDCAHSLRVINKDMHPAIREGWFLLCEPDATLACSEYVAVQTATGNQIVKELVRSDAEGVELASVNDSLDRMTLTWREIVKIHAVTALISPTANN